MIGLENANLDFENNAFHIMFLREFLYYSKKKKKKKKKK